MTNQPKPVDPIDLDELERELNSFDYFKTDDPQVRSLIAEVRACRAERGICSGCDTALDKCGPALWATQRKCCPDCSHVAPAEPSPAVVEALALLQGALEYTTKEYDFTAQPEHFEAIATIRTALERVEPAKSVGECPSDLSPAELAEQHCPFWEMSPAEREEENAKRGPCGKSYWTHDGNEVCALTRGHAGGCR